MLAGVGVVEQLRSCGALDGLFERIDSGGAGDHWDRWPAPRFAQRVALERGLAAELTDHLGYDRGRVGSVGASQHEERDHGQDR